jgi:hypothetical protein
LGSVPETDSLSLDSQVLGRRVRVVSKRLGLPLGGEVLQVTELDGSVRLFKGEAGQGLTLAVSEGSEHSTSDSRGRSRGSLCDSHRSLSNWLGSLGLAVNLSVIVFRGNTSKGSQSVPTEIGDDSTTLLTRHTLLARDEATLLNHSTRFVQDDGLDADSLKVSRGQLEDSQAVLLEQGLQNLKVLGEAGELGTEVRIVVISKDVRGLRDEGNESLVDGGLLFGGVAVVHRKMLVGKLKPFTHLVFLHLSIRISKACRMKCERVEYLLDTALSIESSICLVTRTVNIISELFLVWVNLYFAIAVTQKA